MKRLLFLVAGLVSLVLAAFGAVLPLLPTVPFVILGAYCFARSSPRLEQRLLDHATFGPHIRAWRERGAISRRGKQSAAIAFALSAVIGLVALDWPYWLGPLAAALAGGTFVMTRPAA